LRFCLHGLEEDAGAIERDKNVDPVTFQTESPLGKITLRVNVNVKWPVGLIIQAPRHQDLRKREDKAPPLFKSPLVGAK
jgi:hypothetical protein